MSKISVIIVNWNTKDLLNECLKTVFANIDAHEVFVVDNGSTDGSVEFLKKNYPNVKLIENSDNIGFGVANNKALKNAKGEYVLFLNTDAFVSKEAIDKMVSFMDSAPRAGLCTGTLIKANGKVQDTFGPFPSIAEELIGRSLFKILTPFKYTPKKVSGVSPRIVQSIRGACMLSRRSVLEKLRGFDDRYFLFLEETDLCFRLREKGYEVWWLPEVCVRHEGGGSAGSKTHSARIEYWRARYSFFHIHSKKWQYYVLRSGLLIKLVLDWMLNFIGACIFAKCRNKLKTYSIIIAWHIIGCPGTWGMESGNFIRNGDVFVSKGYVDWWNKHKNEFNKSGRVVKENSIRKILEYGNSVFIKQYKKRWLRKSPCLIEWQLISRLRQLGISTVVPLVHGSGLLVTKKIDNVKDLHSFILQDYEQLDISEKINLFRSLAEFISTFHRKGVCHGDLHAGNILIDNTKKFYVIDFHRAKIKQFLTKRDIINNLIHLDMFFSITVPRRMRLRFLKYYLSDMKLENSLQYYAEKIESGTKKACMRLWKKRDKLYLKRIKYGIKGKCGNAKYVISPQYAHLDIQKMMEHFRPGVGVQLKDSPTSYLSRVGVPQIGEVVLKISRQKRYVNYIKDIFRISRAFRAWEGSLSLITRGISTPEPVMAFENRKFGILRESVVVNKNVADSCNLTMWVREGWEKRDFAFKKEFTNILAGYVKKIHNRGIFPKDLKASNLLVKENGNGLGLYLIDLDHLERRGRVSSREIIKNMVQINKSFSDSNLVSKSMRWRFLRNYFKECDIKNIKNTARQINAKAYS